tara:strand:- start:7663 stop:8469 length:807 start_codon:yes stop_codon:yes gene_type:complete
MQAFEHDYAALIARILAEGTKKYGRNGTTTSLFGMSLVVDNLDASFPVIQGRKMYPQGVLGELAAMLRRPKCVQDFRDWGCNYWGLWANEDGSINVDYGNAWFDFEGFDQIAQLKESLANNPDDRRMIINAWRPHKLAELSLPCCHYSYQFYVRNGHIDMIWTQRSVDMMIGLPSDIIFAAAWLIAIANEFDMIPGRIKFDLGDCHVYQEHTSAAYEYIYRVENREVKRHPTYLLVTERGKDFCQFKPTDILMNEYDSLPAMKLELKA